MINKFKRLTLWMLLLLGFQVSSFGQLKLDPVTTTYALTNVNIITKPGEKIESATVVIKDGLIHAAGKNVSIPANAKVIKADSMYVYAGFIDGLSHTGVAKPEKKDQPKIKNPGDANYEQSGIQPHLQVRNSISVKEKSIANMRKLGFTAAHVVPHGKMFPGSGAFVVLDGKVADDMIVKENVSLYSQLKGAGRYYPNTVIGVLSRWKEVYKQAEQAKSHERAYRNNPNGRTRPNKDRVLQAFYPAIDNQQPVYFKATNVKDIYRIFTLQKELGFPLVLTDVKQGFAVADKIKNNNQTVFITLDLPKSKDKKKAKKSDKKDEKEEASKKEMTPKEKEKEALKARQERALKAHLSQAALFQDKGIKFGFSMVSGKSKDFKANVRKLMEHGLKEETALAALTTVPAQHFGVSQMMGTVEKGKMANLIVTDKPYFDEKSNVHYVFVDGNMHKYDVKKAKAKKKKGNAKDGESSGKAAAVAGVWSYTVAVPGQESTGKITIKKDGDDYSGFMVSDDDEDQEETPIENIAVDGNKLTFSATVDGGGQELALEFDLTVDGESLEGSVSVGTFGSFEVTGSKDPK